MEGEKIKIQYVLNTQIEVHAYEINPSTQNPGDLYLKLQIKHKNEMRVLFTGSKYLRNQIASVPKENLPFTTIIKQDNDRYLFT